MTYKAEKTPGALILMGSVVPIVESKVRIFFMLMESQESLTLKEKHMSFAPGWRGTNVIAQENEQMMAGGGIGKPANQHGDPKWPRRADMSRMHPAELAILSAMQEVEKVGASTNLTTAILKLQEAKDLLSDFIDGKE